MGMSVCCAQCLTLCDPRDCSPPGFSVVRFSRQEYWSGLPCPPPGDLPDLGIKPGYLALQVDSLPSEPPWKLNGGVNTIKEIFFRGNIPSHERLSNILSEK